MDVGVVLRCCAPWEGCVVPTMVVNFGLNIERPHLEGSSLVGGGMPAVCLAMVSG